MQRQGFGNTKNGGPETAHIKTSAILTASHGEYHPNQASWRLRPPALRTVDLCFDNLTQTISLKECALRRAVPEPTIRDIDDVTNECENLGFNVVP